MKGHEWLWILAQYIHICKCTCVLDSVLSCLLRTVTQNQLIPIFQKWMSCLLYITRNAQPMLEGTVVNPVSLCLVYWITSAAPLTVEPGKDLPGQHSRSFSPTMTTTVYPNGPDTSSCPMRIILWNPIPISKTILCKQFNIASVNSNTSFKPWRPRITKYFLSKGWH